MKIKNAQVDHIHAHFVLDACTYAMLISMLLGIPYSFTAHAHDIFIPGRAQLLEEKLSRSKFAICISEYNKNFILEKFPKVRADKLSIIHCGLEPKRFNPKPEKKNDIFTVLAIGRLVEQKGFKYLLKACEILKKHRGLEFVCNIIGEGRDRHLLETIIFESHLSDNVRLLGALEQKAVIEYLRDADLFVLPCVVEKNGSMDGIPVALMEAMALGIPVISTTVSGIPELVENGAGLLVEERDIHGLAMAIKSVLALPNKAREEMGIKGRALIKENFNLEKEVDRLVELFKSA